VEPLISIETWQEEHRFSYTKLSTKLWEKSGLYPVYENPQRENSWNHDTGFPDGGKREEGKWGEAVSIPFDRPSSGGHQQKKFPIICAGARGRTWAREVRPRFSTKGGRGVCGGKVRSPILLGEQAFESQH